MVRTAHFRRTGALRSASGKPRKVNEPFSKLFALLSGRPPLLPCSLLCDPHGVGDLLPGSSLAAEHIHRPTLYLLEIPLIRGCNGKHLHPIEFVTLDPPFPSIPV